MVSDRTRTGPERPPAWDHAPGLNPIRVETGSEAAVISERPGVPELLSAPTGSRRAPGRPFEHSTEPVQEPA